MENFILPITKGNVIIRLATIVDLPHLLDIYKPYVEKTAISFELVTPSLEDFKQRFENISKAYPYVLIEENQTILGYAYAAAFHSREAYAHCAELSIYLAESAKGKGLGHLLYDTLETILKEQHIYNVYACVAFTENVSDPFLTNHSLQFHEKRGYKINGRFKRCGYKFNRWYDMVWMEKFLGIPPKSVEPFIEFPVFMQSLKKN